MHVGPRLPHRIDHTFERQDPPPQGDFRQLEAAFARANGHVLEVGGHGVGRERLDRGQRVLEEREVVAEIDASPQMPAAHAAQHPGQLRRQVVLVVFYARLQALLFQPARCPGERAPPSLDEAPPVLHAVEVLVAPAREQRDAQPLGAQRVRHRGGAVEGFRVLERSGRDRQLDEQAVPFQHAPQAFQLGRLGRGELREIDLAPGAPERVGQLDQRLRGQAGRRAGAKHVAAAQHADHERRVGDAE